VLSGRILSWLSLATLTGLALAAAVVSMPNSSKAAASPPQAPTVAASLAGFAGYYLIRPVTEISADFAVPRILSVPSNTQYGDASTWIGAQNALGNFVQVGITEDQALGLPHGSGPEYRAFWSSTAQDFHPIRFALVHTGDHIEVGMRLASSGWVLEFRDFTSGLTRSIVTDNGGGQLFNMSEWFQEDPEFSADPLRNLPYPSMSEVRFTRLRVDGRPPHLGDENAQGMDVPDGPLLVPTKVRSDSFVVVPSTGYAKQYLRDVASDNLAVEEYDIAVYEQKTGSGGRSGGGKVSSSLFTLINSLDTFEYEVSSQRWPSRVYGPIQTLLARSYRLSIDLRDMESDGPTIAIQYRLLNDEEMTQQTSLEIRKILGLPPPA